MDGYSAFNTSPDSFPALPAARGVERQFGAMIDPPAKPGPSVAATPRQPADCAPHSRQRLLKDSLRQAQEWEQRVAIQDAQREIASQLRMLAENLIKDGNPSILAMCNVRTLLCNNCIQLQGTQGQCDGQPMQPLGQCLLLSESGQ